MKPIWCAIFIFFNWGILLSTFHIMPYSSPVFFPIDWTVKPAVSACRCWILCLRTSLIFLDGVSKKPGHTLLDYAEGCLICWHGDWEIAIMLQNYQAGGFHGALQQMVANYAWYCTCFLRNAVAVDDNSLWERQCHPKSSLRYHRGEKLRRAVAVGSLDNMMCPINVMGHPYEEKGKILSG